MDLPLELSAALRDLLAGKASQRALAAAAGDLSERYRAGHGRGVGDYLRSDLDVAAYATYRFPATYGATYAALSEVQAALPGWSPATVLEVGAGLAPAAWAAGQLWPGVIGIDLVEKDRRLIDAGQRLASHARLTVLRQARWQQQDCLDMAAGAPADLVVLAYVLGELPPDRHASVVERLWARTGGVLLIVEPGTPRGFSLVRDVRSHLIQAGASILAPCPAVQACPMAAGDWCHFSQRIARTRMHRAVKQGSLAYEDEKYSYLAVARQPGLPAEARVIRHPQVRPGHIHLELCTSCGLRQETIGRANGQRFREARDLRWGSRTRVPPSPNLDRRTDHD